MAIEFTDDEIETIKDLIQDFGFEYALGADSKKVWDLGMKLNIAKNKMPMSEPDKE